MIFVNNSVSLTIKGSVIIDRIVPDVKISDEYK